jgi:hypothetical protein
MVYDVQNYWGFEMWPSSCILSTREHKASETVSVSVIMLGESKYLLRWVSQKELTSSDWGTEQSRCLTPHLREGTDPVSETLVLFF